MTIGSAHRPPNKQAVARSVRRALVARFPLMEVSLKLLHMTNTEAGSEGAYAIVMTERGPPLDVIRDVGYIGCADDADR